MAKVFEKNTCEICGIKTDGKPMCEKCFPSKKEKPPLKEKMDSGVEYLKSIFGMKE